MGVLYFLVFGLPVVCLAGVIGTRLLVSFLVMVF